MFDITSEKSTEILNKMINFSALKQKVIANNIANVNTPGYQRLEVNFDRKLEEAIKTNESINDIKVQVDVTKDKSSNTIRRKDGNSVDIDREVSELMQNSLSYNVYLEIMAKKFKIMKQAMRSR